MKRLRELEVVELVTVPGNRRDKWVMITPRGRRAQEGVVRQVALMEEEIANALAPMELETFRAALLSLLEGLGKVVAMGDKKLPPAATRLE